ncbi:threonine--tRNA ligase [Mycobacterium xenopi 3993]|nr:threonine--tRNA ligase [Mycobacterium xenopi 3993]
MSAPAQPASGADGRDPLRPAAPDSRPPQPLIRVPAGTTAAAAVQAAGLPSRGAPDAVVVVRDADGKLRDLSWAPEQDVDVVPVAANTEDGRSVIRHSCAHVLAQAVQDLFPQAKLGIGPPISDGFYYDFDVPEPFTPEDLEALEKRMRQIVKDGQLFSRRVYQSEEQARAELADEPYKLELVEDKSGDPAVMEVGGDELTAYDNLNPRTRQRVWSDLCRGPHIPTTRHIPAFKLTRTSAAYWRGDQNNPSLQRIYGTAWESQEALERHLQLIEEASRRDHRKLGAELDLFSFPDEIGSGLAVFHPKGGIIRRELEDYSRRKHLEAGYEFVTTPHITKAQLFHTSGHLDWYAEAMFPPMHLDAEHNEDGTVRKPGQDYYLKPMNCPMHCLIYRSRGRSYRELPLRLFEFGTVYRYEKSGVVHGLTRARGFTMDDAHIFCTREQLPGELASLLRFVLDLLGDYGLEDFYLELSTKDPEKFVGSEEIWDDATATLAEVARQSGLELVPDPGGRRSTARKSRCRPAMLWPQLADVDHSAGFQLSGAFRTGVHRRRRHPAATGDDPPRAVRLDRAILRHPHRALRGRIPGMAGAGTGGRHPGGRRSRAVPRRCCRATEVAWGAGRSRRQRRPDGQKDRAPHQPQGAVHAAGRRP